MSLISTVFARRFPGATRTLLISSSSSRGFLAPCGDRISARLRRNVSDLGAKDISSAPATNKGNGYRAFYAFALGSLLSSSLVYYLSNASFGKDDPRLQSIPSTKSGLNETYGSAQDFQNAIAELRRTFPLEDKVSTDLEVLELHGFSENDYHPGMHSQCPSIVSMIIHPRGYQGLRRQWSFFLSQLRM